MLRGATVEVVENRDEGVEQSWRFAAEPDGLGDLVVQVSASGFETVSSSASGLHFLSGDRLGFRYSHAAWRDAVGTTWNLPVDWDGSNINIRVPADVLDRSVYPAVLDPTISAEVAMDNPVAGFTGARATIPAIAWSGTQALVVWTDERPGNGTNIYGTRVAADGTVVDGNGIGIAKGELDQTDAVVAWTGSAWLVVWAEEAGDLSAALVAANGAVTQLGSVTATAALEGNPVLASNGSSALLVWQSDDDLRGALFSGGSFGAAFDVAATAAAERGAAIGAASGGDYLVTWEEGTSAEEVRGQLVTGAGAPSGVAFTVGGGVGRQHRPAAAFDGTDFVVAWRHTGDIRVGRVTTAGALLDTTAGVVLATSDTTKTSPAVACDASSCLVAWQDLRSDVTDYGVYGRRVATTNGVLAATGGEILLSDPAREQTDAALAGRASGFMATWTDNRSGTRTAILTPVGGDGSVVHPDGVILPRQKANEQVTPAYGRSAGGHLAVWGDSRSFGDDIMARRFSAKGARLDTEARVVSDATSTQSGPSIDFDGTQFVVAWADARNVNYDIYAARFTNDGTLVDGAGIQLTSAAGNQLATDVASGGGVSLVVWEDRASFDVGGAIVAQDGGVTPIEVCATTGQQVRPAVAWDPAGSVFVAVWSDSRSGTPTIYAARVTTAGDVLDACGVPVATSPEAQVRPSIASSGDSLLVVWEDEDANLVGDIYASRIQTAGGTAVNVLDAAGMPIATGGSSQSQPTVVGLSAGRWGLAWTDDANAAVTGTDIYGSTMLADGTIFLDPTAQYVISNVAKNESWPVFESGVTNANRVYLVYERRNETDGKVRVVRRTLTY
jgi:hypothetical protein